jgi:hypothetical protein
VRLSIRSSPGAHDASIRDAAIRAGDGLAAAAYRGYDPYDALASPLFRLPWLRRAKLPRWGAQQILKRLPVNVRPLLRIPMGYNPVTLALALQGYAYLAPLAGDRESELEERARFCARELARLRSPGYSGDCWGYDFDWEARYARIPAGTPTIVATGLVTNALFVARRVFDLPDAAAMCESAARFVLEDLPRTEETNGSFCWSYSPLTSDAVLNATMKGARLCAQVYSMNADERLLDAALRTAEFVAGRQDERGAWPYSVSDARRFADNFHTAYVLDCFASYEQLTGDARFAEVVARGLAYYRERFFTAGGIPRYYDDRTYPVDATSCAQSILTLCGFGDMDAAAMTGRWAIERMRRRDGGFAYQVHRRYVNRVPYIRWSDAWMFCALARLTRDAEAA